MTSKDKFASKELPSLRIPPSIDYYAVLALPRNASTAEIRNRFLLLSREFHPDRLRHPISDALRDYATFTFPLIDRAYKTLSDPISRYAYDMYGEEGVRAVEQNVHLFRKSHRSIIPKPFSNAKLQQLIANILRQMNQSRLESSFVSYSDVFLQLSASDFLSHPHSLFSLSPFQSIYKTDMSLRHQCVLPFNSSTRWTVGAYLMEKSGLAISGITSQIAYTSHNASLPSIIWNMQLGNAPKSALLFSQAISHTTICTSNVEIDEQGLDIAVGLQTAIHSRAMGSALYGTRDGLSLGYLCEKERYKSSFQIGVGNRLPQTLLQSTKYVQRLFEPQITWTGKYNLDQTKLRASFRGGISMRHISISLGTSFDVLERARMALDVLFAHNGISMQIGFKRGNVRFVIPIFLSIFSGTTATAAFLAAISPHIIFAAVNQILRPNARRNKRQLQEFQAISNYKQLELAKDAAMKQQMLMQRCATEKRQKEIVKCNRSRVLAEIETPIRETEAGLVILMARYGKYPSNPRLLAQERGNDRTEEMGMDSETESIEFMELDGDSEPLEVDWADVTIPLQFFVQNGTMYLPQESKAQLLGFYNPLQTKEAETPQLYVRYVYDDAVFEITIEDLDELYLPSKYAKYMGSSAIMH